MKDLNKLFNECKDELKKINIPFSNDIDLDVMTSKRSWGTCILHRLDNNFTIKINIKLLDDNVPDIPAKNTIIHELLHTCPNCMKHTGEWKEYANKVNCYYSQYNIKRTNSSEEYEVKIKPVTYNYLFKCDKCGKEIGYQRNSSKFVQYYWRYTHSVDGGHFIKIDNGKLNLNVANKI